MEKDYFNNRSPQGIRHDAVRIGELAYICEKSAQKTAKTLEDLTLVVIVDILTSQPIHPRGQKVWGKDYYTGEIKVGRVVYLLQDGKVVTSEGNRYIFELSNKEYPVINK